MVNNNYTHIWDCCCDHGLLGMNLLKRQIADKVHFVDIVPALTEQVHTQLSKHFSSEIFANKWQVHCLDVAKLPLHITASNTEKPSHLIIIAGVGGDLLIEFVQQIVKASPTLKLEFMLCPVHHNYKVRKALIDLEFDLINEAIVCENKRFYEVIHVVRNSQQTPKHQLTDVGSTMWDLSIKSHQEYLSKTLSHYRKMQSKPKENVSKVIASYEALTL